MIQDVPASKRIKKEDILKKRTPKPEAERRKRIDRLVTEAQFADPIAYSAGKGFSRFLDLDDSPNESLYTYTQRKVMEGAV